MGTGRHAGQILGAKLPCVNGNRKRKTTSQNVYAQDGTLDKYGVELLGAKLPSINRAEDRNLFKEAMARIGLKTPQSGIANNIEEALKVGTGFGAHRAAAALGQLCSAEDV